MPTSERIFSMLRRSLVSSMPSTMIWPLWCASSRLMQRIHVLLPDPDGPSTTTISCSLIVAVMPLRAWKSPNHLSTSRHTIMSSRAASSSDTAMVASP